MASEPVTYLARDPNDIHVLAIAPEISRRSFNYITVAGRRGSAGEMQPLASESVQGRYLLFTSDPLLPDDVIGYESISAFLWDGGPFGPLEKEQELALKSWVYMGGTLIVAGGENAQVVGQSFLADILPVEIQGVRSGILEQDFRDKYGSAPMPGEPVMYGLASVRDGEILLGTEARPLIVRSDYGSGHVIYVAFSLASWGMRDWEAHNLMLNDLFANVRPILINQLSGDARETVDAFMKNTLLAELPSAFFIVLFLGIYIILVVPVNYFIFRMIKRIEWAWFALPIIAIAFGLLAYNIGYMAQSRTLDSDEVTFVEGRAGSPVVFAKSLAAIYAPGRISKPLEFPDRIVLPRPLMAVDYTSRDPDEIEKSRNPIRLTYDNGYTVRDFRIFHWAARSMECDYVADLGGTVEGALTVSTTSTLTGTIQNNLGYALENVALVVGSGMMYSLGTLQPGARYEFDSERANAYNGGAPQWMKDALLGTGRRPIEQEYYGPGGRMMPMSDKSLFLQTRGSGEDAWFAVKRDDILPGDTALLMAWSPRSLLKVEVGDPKSPLQLNRRNQTLVHFYTIPFVKPGEASERLGGTFQLERVGEAFWKVNITAEGESQAPPSGTTPQDMIDLYHQTSRQSQVVYHLPGPKSVLEFSPDPVLGLKAPEFASLKVSFSVNKMQMYNAYRGGQNINGIPKTGLKFQIYDFESKDWREIPGSEVSGSIPGGGVPGQYNCRIELPLNTAGPLADLSRYDDGGAGVFRLRIEITDPEYVQMRQQQNQYQIMEAFLTNLRIEANLKNEEPTALAPQPFAVQASLSGKTGGRMP
jgi:hypothetical protein